MLWSYLLANFQYKFAAIFSIFEVVFWNGNPRLLIHISLKSLPNGPINDKSSLIQVMAWFRMGKTSLPEQIWTQLAYAPVS